MYSEWIWGTLMIKFNLSLEPQKQTINVNSPNDKGTKKSGLSLWREVKF